MKLGNTVNTPDDREILNSALTKLWEWVQLWCMEFNTKKCQVLYTLVITIRSTLLHEWAAAGKDQGGERQRGERGKYFFVLPRITENKRRKSNLGLRFGAPGRKPDSRIRSGCPLLSHSLLHSAHTYLTYVVIG
jgi:hypothetical protein